MKTCIQILFLCYRKDLYIFRLTRLHQLNRKTLLSARWKGIQNHHKTVTVSKTLDNVPLYIVGNRLMPLASRSSFRADYSVDSLNGIRWLFVKKISDC